MATKGLGWLHLVNNGRSISKPLSVVVINRKQANEFKNYRTDDALGYMPTAATIRRQEQF